MEGLHDEAFARHFSLQLKAAPTAAAALVVAVACTSARRALGSLSIQEEVAALRDARAYAPVVVGQVIRQLEELEDLVETMNRAEDPSHEAAAQCTLKLAEYVRQERWHWSPDYDAFRANVEEKLFRELRTPHLWHQDLKQMRECSSPEAYAERSLARLREYKRASRMSVTERLVFEACMERANFVIDAPHTPPPSLVWLAAWLGTIAGVSGICYFLLSTASTLGRAHSALWLAHLSVGFAVKFAVILPSCRSSSFMSGCPISSTTA